MSDKYKTGEKNTSNVTENTPARTQRNTNAVTKEDLSATALKRLSEVRRGEFHDASQKNAGHNKYGDTTNHGMIGVSGNPQKKIAADIQRAIDTTPSISKVANFGTTGPRGSADRMMPEIYSPLFQIANLNLPRDRMTMNAWNRNFFDTHPIVRNAITLHATYPISKINVKCKHRKVEQFFNEMAEKIDLFEAIAGVALEYWKHGEKVSGDAYLTMADGTVKQIKDIRIGDDVITHLGNKKKVTNIFKKPTNVVIEEHIKIYKIKTVGLPEPLIISGRHPIFALSQNKIACQTPSCKKKNMRIWPETNACSNCGKKYKNMEVPEFMETSEVVSNDLVCASFNTSVVENGNFSPELCYLMGFWAAEGSYLKRNNKYETKYIGIRISQNDKEFLHNYIEPLFIKAMGGPGRLYTNKTASYFGELKTEIGEKHNYHFEADVRDGNEWAQFFLEHCGEYSNDKKMSEAIMLLPINLQLQILAGFIDGDGCVDQSNGHIIIATTSQNLANQFLLLLRRCGIRPTMSKILSKNENESDRYRIKIVANEAYDNFYSLLLTDKKEKLHKTKWMTQRTSLQNNWQLLPIKNIEDITDGFTDSYMYDIEVEDDHSYIANGMAIHNCFPYAEIDENNGIWSSIVIQNPDYVTVRKSGVSNTSIISLRPDEIMKKIVSSNHPSDIKLRSQMPDNIIHHIRKNEPIPLDNFNISHLKLLSSPYDVRGTSIIVSCYKDLMHYDKLRECLSQDTEILTDNGFKKWQELIDIDVNGEITPNTNYKICSYNTETDELEYHVATDVVLRDYVGQMKHIKGQKVDVCVTPGHRMYIKTTGKKDKKTYWKDYYFTEAKNITQKTFCKLKTRAKYVSALEPENIIVGDKTIGTELFLEFLGYIVSEGCVYVKTDNDKNGNKRYDHSVSINQYTSSKFYQPMRNTMQKIADIFGNKLSNYVRVNNTGYAINNPGEQWNGKISSRELALYLKKQIGVDGNTISHNKHLPRWALNLSPRLLRILLSALIDGDGGRYESKYGTDAMAYRYSTVSRQLADDVYELVYKCGYTPTISMSTHKHDDSDDTVEYIVLWSNTDYGDEPIVYSNPDHFAAKVYDEDYNGKVWCVTVPTGAMVIRLNGKISIQGNCKFAQADSLINPITLISVGGSGEGEYHPTSQALEAYREIFEQAQWDKDFKIITHAAVKVERVGATGQIVDTQNDFNFIRENLYAGLMVPKSIMDTEGSAYAAASIGLEVLRTRYITFRNMIEKWLEKKIFAPISQIQGFFEYRNGEKVLIVPQIDWNHINLYDLNDYIQALGQYVDKNKVSVHTLYRSLGLNFEEEKRLLRQEAIDNNIAAKELKEFESMSLVELRALDPDEPIVESGKENESVPGETAAPESSTMPGEMPDLSAASPSMPAMEPAPEATPTEPPK